MIFSLEETTMTKSEYLCSNRKFPTHGDQSKLNIVEILCYNAILMESGISMNAVEEHHLGFLEF